MSVVSWISVTQVYGHTLCPALLTRDSIVLDAGANVGRFIAGIKEHAACRCIAVEPNSRLASALNDQGVETYQLAISRGCGEATLTIDDNSEASSIENHEAPSGQTQITVATVDVETLARRLALERIDLLKMDIEGAEIDAFQAMSDDFVRSIGQLTVEFHDFTGVPVEQIQSVIKRLRRLGFATIRFSRNTYGDVWFLNRRRFTITRANLVYLQIYRLMAGIERMSTRLLRNAWARG